MVSYYEARTLITLYDLLGKYLNFKDYVFGGKVTHTGRLRRFVRAVKSQKFGDLQHVIQMWKQKMYTESWWETPLEDGQLQNQKYDEERPAGSQAISY